MSRNSGNRIGIAIPAQCGDRREDARLYHSTRNHQDMHGSSFEKTQSTRKTMTVASSLWRPSENSSIDRKIPSTISSALCASCSATALNRPSSPHSSPAGFTASVTPSVNARTRSPGSSRTAPSLYVQFGNMPTGGPPDSSRRTERSRRRTIGGLCPALTCCSARVASSKTP